MDNDRQAVRELMTCVNIIDEVFALMAKALGMKENTLAFFYALDDGRAHSQKLICDEWLIPRTTLNTIVKECVEEGYVVLEPEPHSREKTIRLTERGLDYTGRALGRVYAAESRALTEAGAGFIPELRRFADALRRETDHI